MLDVALACYSVTCLIIPFSFSLSLDECSIWTRVLSQTPLNPKQNKTNIRQLMISGHLTRLHTKPQYNKAFDMTKCFNLSNYKI